MFQLFFANLKLIHTFHAYSQQTAVPSRDQKRRFIHYCSSTLIILGGQPVLLLILWIFLQSSDHQSIILISFIKYADRACWYPCQRDFRVNIGHSLIDYNFLFLSSCETSRFFSLMHAFGRHEQSM